MKVLAIDPGIAYTGWAVLNVEEDKIKLDKFGIVHTTKKDGEDWDRAQMIAIRIGEFIKEKYLIDGRNEYFYPIDTVIVEEYRVYSRSFKPKYAEKTLRVIQAIEDKFWWCDTHEISNNTWRGKRKELQPIFQQITKGVKLPKGDHVQDAIYMGLYYIFYRRKK